MIQTNFDRFWLLLKKRTKQFLIKYLQIFNKFIKRTIMAAVTWILNAFHGIQNRSCMNLTYYIFWVYYLFFFVFFEAVFVCLALCCFFSKNFWVFQFFKLALGIFSTLFLNLFQSFLHLWEYFLHYFWIFFNLSSNSFNSIPIFFFDCPQNFLWSLFLSRFAVFSSSLIYFLLDVIDIFQILLRFF